MHINTELALIDSGAFGVVVVVVGDEQSIDVFNVASVRHQSQQCLLAADPRVKEQTHTPRLYIDAVTIAPGLQRNSQHARIILTWARSVQK